MAIIVLVVTLTAYPKISNVKISYLSGYRIWICKCLSDFSLIVGEHNWIHDILHIVHHLLSMVRSAGVAPQNPLQHHAFDSDCSTG